MLCDMEGVSGLYTREHAWFWEENARAYVGAEGRRLLTEDINSAAAVALASGVDELVVCDTHHGGGNVLWDQLLADPRIVYETPQAARMMPSLDEAFDGLILLGHHAKAGTQGAFLDHTWGDWFDFQINGMSVGEIGIEACYAGHWDVPLMMVQGDEACCAEAESQFPGVVTAAVKRGISFGRASGPAPEVARALTAEKVAEAVAKAHTKELKPFKPSCPMAIRVTTLTTAESDRLALRPGVRRLDGRTVEAEVERQCDILNWIAG
jgi:D-amino peptidase